MGHLDSYILIGEAGLRRGKHRSNKIPPFPPYCGVATPAIPPQLILRQRMQEQPPPQGPAPGNETISFLLSMRRGSASTYPQVSHFRALL